MRQLLLLLTATMAVSAYAYDMECERQVNATDFTFAHIERYPLLLAQVGTKHCTPTGPVKFCVEQPEETVSDLDRICGYPVDQRFECRTIEYTAKSGNYIVDNSCPRWSEHVVLSLRPNGTGTLMCMNGNRVERSWRLGHCGYGR
jgi:hypothetical protein